MKKKIKSVLVVASLLFMSMIALTGCGNSKKDEKPLVGSWKYEAGDYMYVFKEDLTGEYQFWGTQMTFKYVDNGDSVEITYDDSTTSNKFDYRIEGNTLIIKDSFGSEIKYNKI